MPFIGLRRIGSASYLTIRASIFIGFALMCVFIGVLGYSSAQMIKRSAALVVETFDRSLMSIDYARAAAADFSAMQTGFLRLRLATTAARQKEREAELEVLAKTFYEDLDISATRSQSARAKRAAQTVKNAVDGWQRSRNDIDPQLPLSEVLANLDVYSETVNHQIDLLINLTAGDGFLHRQQALRSIQTETEMDIAFTLAALLLSAIVTLVLTKRISGPVSAASAIAARIASGDLDVAIPEARRDELGDLLRSMSIMRDSIRAMMQAEVSQRQSAQARLMDAIENSREGVLLVDTAGRVVIANSPLAAFFGDLNEQLAPGASLSSLIQALVRTKLVEESRLAIDALPWSSATDSPGTVEIGLLDGRWLRVSWCPTREGELVAFFSDITLSRSREAQLKQTNLWFDAALTNMSQGLCVYDSDSRLKVVNARFRDIYNLSADQIRIGTTIESVLSLLGSYKKDTSRAAQDSQAIRARIATRAMFAQQDELADGRVIAFSHRPISDGGWVLAYEDVTERHRSEARISFMARHDPLTALPNRALFGERLEQGLAALEQGGSLGLLLIDLDRFKEVNDTHGHPIGDALLRLVAQRLLACSREGDTVARLGGDEFALIGTSLSDADDAKQLAARIIQTLVRPFAIEGYRIEIGASVGIAMATNSDCDSDTLFRDADIALYSVKKEGRGSYSVFTPDMESALHARRVLEHDLLQSVANGEMELAYQPMVALNDGQIRGFEALLRWNHPTRGRIMPDEFIWLSEETGFIDKLGAWILRQACKDAVQWPEPQKIAINVSPVQFRSGKLIRYLEEALRDTGVAPSRVELEITETTLLHENEANIATLRNMHALGVRIVLDDFGTGFSSLSYLRSFPFDRIKIDRSFVKDFGLRNDADAIIHAILGLGKSLRIPVTAEGVETYEQLELLRVRGCDEVQGHLISKPIRAGDIPALAASVAATLAAATVTSDGGLGGQADRPAYSPPAGNKAAWPA
ncbi:MAG: EAL domain-containing protein [Rhodopila sp.]|nr:EAL domain-containing protein [Rhodopila sp.]